MGDSETFSEEVVCEKCGNSVNKLDYERHLKTHKEKRGKKNCLFLNYSSNS